MYINTLIYSSYILRHNKRYKRSTKSGIFLFLLLYLTSLYLLYIYIQNHLTKPSISLMCQILLNPLNRLQLQSLLFKFWIKTFLLLKIMYVPLNLCIHPIGLSPKIIRLSINSYQYSLQNGLRIQTPGYPIHTFLFETSTHIMILSCNVTFCLPVSRVFKSIFSPSIKLYWSRKTV